MTTSTDVPGAHGPLPPELVALTQWAAENTDGIVPRVVDRIRAGSGAFRALPLDAHESSFREQYQAFLASLAEDRPPNWDELEGAREFAREQGRQLFPMDVLIAGYHLGARTVWDILLEEAGRRGPATRLALLDMIDQSWLWVQHMCGAVADGYSEARRARDAAQIALRHRLIETLYSGGADQEEAAFMARALGFEPDAVFQAACAPASAWSDPHFEALGSRLRPLGATVHAAVHGTLVVVLVQGVVVESVDGVLPPDAGEVLGIGMPRKGLGGAAESIGDAERALGVAQARAGAVAFEAEWLTASLRPHRDRLAPLLRSPVPAQHPHLAEAVLAYAQHGFSITASAAVLQVHPNTLAYRLDRWRHHTGWDPRTWDGLARSLAGIALYPDTSPGEPGS